jgi:hypothetical protein
VDVSTWNVQRARIKCYTCRCELSRDGLTISEFDRPPLLGDVREALMSAYGAKWGFAMINQSAIPENAATAIRAVFDAIPNQLREAEKELDVLIEQARVGHEIEQERPRIQPATAGRAISTRS